MTVWLERLYNLRRGRHDAYERPHKPVLLLSIFNLVERQLIRTNAAAISDDLITTFKQFFETVRQHNDQPTIENPLFYLQSDGFWTLVPKQGEAPLQVSSGAASLGTLRRVVAHGRFDDSLWTLIDDPVSRHQLREALIARYFPESRDKLAAALAGDTLRETPADLPPGRDAAFRRTILEIYDHTCTACGIRVLLTNQQRSLVTAAHIIPFATSYNDKPTNGLALCPNHHWAMDSYLISPCPDGNHSAGVWKVHPSLDDRKPFERDLISLAGRRVIPPAEEKFLPAREGLEWRCRQLKN
jgi:putative restriction endonuclease